jgi:N6-L-threonylcarbamoyladenine synthase
MSIILGIESSCDETGVAIVEGGLRVLANEVASQIDIHKEFGGVVPEIASRQHTRVISQLVDKVLRDTGAEADAIAATRGPGLMGSLLVGLSFGKALAYAWNKPFIGVHHIEGHIFSAMLGERAPEFPFLALVVSGGHTQLVDCPEPHRYVILGTTRDDAVGESFDKVARLLGLPYPGGPSIQKAAEPGNPAAFKFPRAMLDSDRLEFSYSGLKTAVLYVLRDMEARGEDVVVRTADLAASFQHAAVDVLLIKTKQAIRETGAQRLVLAGGVAANRLLRDRLTTELAIDVFLPPLKYCIDNGAMIAAAGQSRLDHGLVDDLRCNASPGLAL